MLLRGFPLGSQEARRTARLLPCGFPDPLHEFVAVDQPLDALLSEGVQELPVLADFLREYVHVLRPESNRPDGLCSSAGIGVIDLRNGASDRASVAHQAVQGGQFVV